MGKKLTYNYVKNYIETNECKLISASYKNEKELLELECKCGNHFYKSFDNFKNKNQHRCNDCYLKELSESKSFDIEFVKKYLKETLNYELLSDSYKNANQKIDIKCDKGHIYTSTFSSIKCQHSKCPYCAKLRIDYDDVKHYIDNNTDFELLSEIYKNNNSKLKLKCSHGHIFYSTWQQIYNMDQGCPSCKKSKGENQIKKFLEYNLIKFLPQYKFKDCKDKKSLPFDFYIPDLNVCIEYDGEFHYKPRRTNDPTQKEKMFESFITCQQHDNIKNSYCRDNNIKLIRIPYWDFNNIECILSDYLIKIA